jgi:hypothetical protein
MAVDINLLSDHYNSERAPTMEGIINRSLYETQLKNNLMRDTIDNNSVS